MYLARKMSSPKRQVYEMSNQPLISTGSRDRQMVLLSRVRPFGQRLGNRAIPRLPTKHVRRWITDGVEVKSGNMYGKLYITFASIFLLTAPLKPILHYDSGCT